MDVNVVSWTSMVRACGSIGDLRAARRVFDEMPEKNVVSWNCVLSGYTQLGMFEQALELFFRMEWEGVVPDGYTFVSALSACAHLGALETGKRVDFALVRRGVELGAEVGTALVEMYAKCGDVNTALRIFFEIAENDVFCWNVMIKELGISERSEDAMKLFGAMKGGGVELNDFTFMSVKSYEGLLLVCGKGGLHEDVKLVLSHMNSKGIVPSPKAYTGVVEAYGQAALYEEALVAFNTMHEIKSLPTVETYNSLMNSFARGGLFKEAQAILSRMNGAGIQRDVDSFNGLIEAYCQGGQFEDSVKAYVDLQKSRLNPSERTLELILNVYCSAGLVDESREQFQEIQSSGDTPSVMAYCMMISVYAKNDRWGDVYQLLEEMKTSRVSNTHQVIGSMIKGDYDDESNWQMVEYVFDKYHPEGCGFGLRFYNALLEALWWLGQKARAARVLGEATKKGLFPELYRQSKLVWSVDVHRMSVGGALTAISVWLNDIHQRFRRGNALPHLATVVVVRGEMEKSSVTRELPVAKAAYSFLKNEISPSFQFPGWNKGRIICHRLQLKRLLSTMPHPTSDEAILDIVSITDSDFPLPGTKIYTTEIRSDGYSETEDETNIESEAELMAMTTS